MTFVKLNNRSVPANLDSVFSDLWSGFTGGISQGFSAAPVNVHETKEGYHVEVSAPGLNKEDFGVKLENGLLTISYEKKEEANKADDYKTLRREFHYRGFKRSFSLNDDVNAENIQAKYENGILKVFLPKTEPAQNGTRQINIQ